MPNYKDPSVGAPVHHMIPWLKDNRKRVLTCPNDRDQCKPKARAVSLNDTQFHTLLPLLVVRGITVPGLPCRLPFGTSALQYILHPPATYAICTLTQ